MKKITTLFLAATILASCGEPDKQAQLADLKKQLAEINSQIKTLETEIAANGGDSTKAETGTSVAVQVLKNQLFQHQVLILLNDSTVQYPYCNHWHSASNWCAQPKGF
jgi:outer membrane murein-binding lipoprotein Lpp